MRLILDGRPIQDHFPGIGRYLYNLAAGLAGLPDAPEIILLHDPARPSTRFDLAALGVRLEPLPVSPFDPRGQLSVPRRLRVLRADLYHAGYYLMPYWAGLPTVVTLYDVIPLIYPHYMPSPTARWAYRWLNALAGRRARRVLAISQAAAGDLTRHLGLAPARISVAPLAADARFCPATDGAALERWRGAAGLPARFALYVGINKPHKNLPRLVAAWDIVRRSWPAGAGERPRLILAGREDPRYPETRRAVAAAGLTDAIHFLPDVDDNDLPLLYNAASAFVFPSLYEGFGLPVLEALACGVPTACSERSSLPEIAGGAAELFDPTAPEAIAGALLRLLTDAELRRRRSAEGLARAATFSWQRTAQRTLDCYRLALDPGRQLTADS